MRIEMLMAFAMTLTAAGLVADDSAKPAKPADAAKGGDERNADDQISSIVERSMTLFDKDGDGKLNREELAAAIRAREGFGRPPIGPGGRPGLGPDGRPAGGFGPPPPEVLQRFDKDGDGKLNEEERAAAMKLREGLARDFDPGNLPDFVVKRFDKNSDGKLTGDELSAAREQFTRMQPGPGGRPGFGALPPEAMKRFDKDGDGKLSEEERAAAMKARDIGKRPGAGNLDGANIPEAVIKRFDKDGDGKLNDAERAAAKAALDRRGGGPDVLPGEGKPRDAKVGNEELLKKFDKNGDGKLNDEEKAAAREALQNRAK